MALYFETIAEVFEKEHNRRSKNVTENKKPKSKELISQTQGT
jgi:hypothetical protein